MGNVIERSESRIKPRKKNKTTCDVPPWYMRTFDTTNLSDALDRRDFINH